MRKHVAFVVLCLSAAVASPPAQAAVVVRGKVVELETGRIIRGASITVPEYNLHTESDSTGRYLLTGLLPGLRTVQASAAFRQLWVGDVRVNDGDTTQFDIQMKRVPNRGGLAGTVTANDGKKPVKHAAVVFGSPPVEGRADDDGFFNTPNIDPGIVKLRAGGLGYEPYDFELPVLEGRTTVFTVDLGRSLLEGGGSKKRKTPKLTAADTLSKFRFLVRDRLPSAPAGPSRRVPTAIRIYDEANRPVRSIGEWRLYPGPYMVPWDGRDSTGKAVSHGRYKLHFRLDDSWSDGEELLTR